MDALTNPRRSAALVGMDTALAGGTDVAQPGDALLDIAIAYVTANSPIDPQEEGRIVGP